MGYTEEKREREREMWGLMDNVLNIKDRSIKTLFFHLGPKLIFYLVWSPQSPFFSPWPIHHKSHKSVLKPHTDLGFHFFPALLLSADYVLYSPPWTIRPLQALILSATIAFGYWFWVEACHARNGFYPYPIFAHLDTVGRIGLFSLSAGLMTASAAALKGVYWLVHGNERGVGPELRRRKVKWWNGAGGRNLVGWS